MITVARTCGCGKAIKRAFFIFLQKCHVPKEGECVFTKLGYKMYVISHDMGISSELKTCGIHEPLTTKMLINTIKRGWTIIDVGSNLGYYALLEAKLVGEKGKVIAIEPMPKNFQYLKHNVILNKANNVILLNCAISDKEKGVTMIQSSYSNWCRVIDDRALEVLKNESCHIVSVPAIKIDSVVKRFGLKDVNLIRMDIEGHEYNAVRSARETIKNHHPDLLIEIHTKYLKELTKRLLGLLRREGYGIGWAVVRDVDFLWVGNEKDVKLLRFNGVMKFPKNDIMIYFTTKWRERVKIAKSYLKGVFDGIPQVSKKNF